MNKKFLGMLCIIALSVGLTGNCVSYSNTSSFIQHYDSAQAYLNQGQYSSAIVEFRKALRINYLDNSARIGLINSYLSRATYYANQEKKYDNAAGECLRTVLLAGHGAG